METTSPEPGLQTTRPTDGIQSVDTSDIKPADRPSDPAEYAISFGPFRLLATRRLLLDGDKQLRIGSRALDLLVALVERPGELVSKPELIAKVRPHTFVDESNLKARAPPGAGRWPGWQSIRRYGSRTRLLLCSAGRSVGWPTPRDNAAFRVRTVEQHQNSRRGNRPIVAETLGQSG